MEFFSKFKNFKKGPNDTPATSMTMEEPRIGDVPPTTVMTLEPPVAAPQAEEIVQAPQKGEKVYVEVGLDEFGIDELLTRLVQLGGSDLHLESGASPVFRIKGDMCFASDIPELSNEDLESIILPIISERDQKTFEKVGNLDFAHEIEGLARFRGNLLKQYNGIGGVFRVIPSKIPTVEELNLPAVLKKLAMSKRGIVIVTGPTGSGKSTTMAAMINYVNQNRCGHIITIEDPIEFTHPSINCLIDHRQVGLHTRSFPEALKAALREDPDIILVGEMRDLETIGLAITAAEMGVLVFGTLHTNSAAKTIDRIIDVFPAKQQEQVRSQLSQSLKGIVAQQLLKTADGKGRCAVVEVLLASPGVSNLIREGKTGQIGSFMLMGKEDGMITMDDALLALVEKGKITKELAFSRSIEKAIMKNRLGIR
jgi:twitching motility protein PilT